MKNVVRRLLVAWAALTGALALASVACVVFDVAKAFFLMLLSASLVLLLLAVSFRRRIDRVLTAVAADIDRVNVLPASERVQTRYRRERVIGGILVAIAAVGGLYVAILSVADVEAYSALIREDGVVENVSAILWFLAAAVLVISVAVRWKGAQRTVRGRMIWLYSPIIAFFITCGGEEISWGQRVLDVETPEAIRAVNVQQEITIHNIGSISVFSNAFFLIAATFFLLPPLGIKRWPSLGNYLRHYGVPTPNRFAVWVFLITLAVWLFVGIRFGTLGFHPYSFLAERYYNQMDDEIFECLAAYSFLAFAVMDCAKLESRQDRV
ncbi:MAG: hypothetical protein JW809_01975 [Pirellulales bacterium]|nr:hypothetical protein [Pirellulales bacterium]